MWKKVHKNNRYVHKILPEVSRNSVGIFHGIPSEFFHGIPSEFFYEIPYPRNTEFRASEFRGNGIPRNFHGIPRNFIPPEKFREIPRNF